MAINAAVSLGVQERVTAVVPITVAACTVVANTAVSTGTTLSAAQNFTSMTGGGIRWVKLAQGVTRVKFRARYAVGTTTVTTSPVVKLIGAYSSDNITLTSDNVASGTASFTRLDNVTSNVAAGQTVTLTVPGSTAGTNDVLRDDTYAYSNWVTNPATGDVWFDTHGCQYVSVPVFTAASVSGGADTVVAIEMVGVN